MKKNITKKLFALALASGMAFATAACNGGGKKGYTQVNFAFGADTSVRSEFTKLVNTFNDTVGEENKIYVYGQPNAYNGFDGVVSNTLTDPNGADVVTLEDEWFKSQTLYLEKLDGLVSDATVDKLYSNLTDRLLFNTETKLADANASRYALPAYNNATVLYVNVSALKEADIVYISVDEEDLDEFNAGTKADNNGNTKADLGITTEVLAKGFQRQKPFVNGRNNWQKPSSGEVMIFNDRIAMNWDETEDLGRIMTSVSSKTNSNSPTSYGFYSEWWFAYGWTVGGDCIVDIDGNLNYRFGLVENVKNYIVQPGKTYTGLQTGTEYTAGETLAFIDKIAIEEGQTVVAESSGTFTVNGSEVQINSDVSAKVADGTLGEMPSTKEAFTRWASFAANEYDETRISPYPSEFGGMTSIDYFTGGDLAMVVERVSNYSHVKTMMSDGEIEWTVALLPKYKEYTNPTSATSDEVKVEGKQTAHSHLSSVGIRKNTKVKEAAATFVEWLVTEGQKLMAQDGFGTVNGDYETEALGATSFVKNTLPGVVGNQVSGKGDWAYLEDRIWIDVWAIPLNSNVRQGSLTLESWFRNYVADTNTAILGYYD